MAFIDVSGVLLDPAFADKFTVNRRLETVGIFGRASVQTFVFETFGVVTSASPNDLSRLADYDSFGRAISIVTRFKLRGETRDASGNAARISRSAASRSGTLRMP